MCGHTCPVISAALYLAAPLSYLRCYTMLKPIIHNDLIPVSARFVPSLIPTYPALEPG